MDGQIYPKETKASGYSYKVKVKQGTEEKSQHPKGLLAMATVVAHSFQVSTSVLTDFSMSLSMLMGEKFY